MKPVNVHEAKTHLSRLIDQARAGQDVVIARNNVPLVRLVPVERPQPRRKFGALAGRIRVDDRFFEPLPESELACWEDSE
jgi:prevent-host-death family protein